MKIIIVANWKMNPDSSERAFLLAKKIEQGIKENKNVEIVVAPPFPFLLPVSKILKKARLGAQNLFWADIGPYTGEVSWRQLKSLKVSYVIIGHSERRSLGETDELINKKIKAALKAKLKPILCIDKISQIPPVTKGLILAFEPLSAIGTGRPYDIDRAKKIREKIKHPFVLYGGSVNSKNAVDYIEKAGFQGLLVGGISLKPKEFLNIINRLIDKKSIPVNI